MTEEYRVVEKVGELQLDEELVSAFVSYLNNTELQKTHVAMDEEEGEETGNPDYNKYIIHDEIFTQFFTEQKDYDYFLKKCIHTTLLPSRDTPEDEVAIRKIIGIIHAFFMEYYKKFFLMRISVSITDEESFMHYHRDLAAENADRFLVDITDPGNKMHGIEVEDRLYSLDRLSIYKLDTSRRHRGSNFSHEHKKISFIIQCISELDQFIDYQRKHLDLFYETRDKDKERDQGDDQENEFAMNFPTEMLGMGVDR